VKRKILLLLVVLIFVVTGCGKEKIKETANVDSRDHEAYYSFTDSLGNSVVLEEKPERVVSLLRQWVIRKKLWKP
jgi:iron complex transport system substrate-binding protein